MKTLLSFLLACSLNVFAAPNSIIAIVNDSIITLNSISAQINDKTTAEQKMTLVDQQINIELQNAKIQALGIQVKPDAINQILNEVAEQNNITFEQLRANDQFEQIFKTVTQNLSLQGLRQIILQQSGIKDLVKQDVFFANWVKDLRENAYIEIFTDKLK